MDLRDNHVLVITDSSGLFNIGASRNPEKRVLELRRVNPSLGLVATLKKSHGTAYRRRMIVGSPKQTIG